MLKNEPAKPPRGRPSVPESELKQKMIQATIELLFEDGYALTTIENVAKRAGIAKKTIYRFVENRETLIELVILSWTDSFVSLFEQEAHSVEQFFELLALNLNTIAKKVLCTEAIGLYRLLQTEFKQKEILLAKYQKSGIERSRQLLTQWLRKQAEKNYIKQYDFVILSDLILSMAIAEPLRQISLGIPPEELNPRLEDRIQHVVQFCQTALNVT